MSKQVTLGSFEVVSLPELGMHDVVAKVDTGAYSGAVHCTDIKVVRRGVTRKKILCCVPAGSDGQKFETTDFVKKFVRSSTGHKMDRYIIKTQLVINGITYPTEIGVSDRSDLKKPVLIGRRFLRQQKMLVDVLHNVQYDDERETLK